MSQVLIALEVDERSLRLDRMNELPESLYVLRESREHIDMIPRDTRQDSYMRMVPQKLTAQIQRTRQVLVALKNGVLGRVA